MGDSRVSDPLDIQSHTGPYRVTFETGEPFAGLDAFDGALLLDRRVDELYGAALAPAKAKLKTVYVDASEDAKSLERLPEYVVALSTAGFRRGGTLVAVGGGVVQDIACFLAAVYMRGVDWAFYPTTLLAQADSCIGSKSSINVGGIKNLVGTFTPPRAVAINARVLETLTDPDIRSGIGEMLKVHAIAGPAAFDALSADYDAVLTDRATRLHYVRESLRFKQVLIEQDEFDRGPRLVMNYGHTFGHAIESATDYAIPHGIAVTIGMEMANYVAAELGVTTRAHHERMRGVLVKNAGAERGVAVPAERVLAAIARDKKNVGDELTLILPGPDGRIARGRYPNDARFAEVCRAFLAERR
jgi:3-dehydroquinate synthase